MSCRPESQGLVCASIYILLLILFIPFAFSNFILNFAEENKTHEGISVVQFPHYQVSQLVFVSVLQSDVVLAISLFVVLVIALNCYYAWFPRRCI